MKPAAILLALAVSAAAQQPARISSGVMAGQLIHKVAPQFPPEAAAAHVSGTVVMHVLIGEDGTVKEVEPISGPAMLRPAYGDAVKQWIYRPYLLNGKPTAVDTTVSISYQMGAPAPAQRIRISSGILASLNLTCPLPAYPAYTKDDHVAGTTTIHVIVGKDGHILQADLISGPPARTPYEMDAIKQWTYKPYLLNGQPVEVDSTIVLRPNFGG